MPEPRTKLFYKIGEVSRLAEVEPYILRYWETEFPTLCPRKNHGGQRVYQPRDLEMVLSIKRMLHEEGYTIAGARKKLAERTPAKKEGSALVRKEVSASNAPREKVGGASGKFAVPPGTQLDWVAMDEAGGRRGPESMPKPAMSDSLEEGKKLASALGRFKDELIEILDLIK